MSGAWLSALRDFYKDRVEVVGLVDLNEKAAVSKAAEFGLTGIWIGSSLEDTLRKTRPDLLFNCTIAEAHTPTCEAALNAGCHVLVEKPLALTVAEGIHLKNVAATAGSVLAVIQNRRYLPGAIAVKKALAEGCIGRVNALYADFFLGPRFGGFRESMRHPLLLDMAIHTFDQCRYLTDLDPEWVVCHEFNPSGSWYAHGASAIALFEMKGGVLFSYRGSWCARGFPTAWAGTWRIVGEQGTLLWDGETKVEVERVNGARTGKALVEDVERISFPIMALKPAQLGHAGNIGEFLDAVDSGTLPQTNADDNLKSLAMVEAAIESALSSQPVSMHNLLSL